MCDFVEIWDLRNKLILDGFYPKNDDEPVDGLELEKKITRLAREHYNWQPPEPRKLSDMPVGAEDLASMTPLERIEDAVDILHDWDGYRSVRGLGSLIDEVRERLTFPTFTLQEYVDEGEKFWENKTVEDYLNSRKFKREIKVVQNGKYYVNHLIPYSYRFIIKEKIESYGLYCEFGYLHRKEGLIEIRYWRKHEPFQEKE